MTHLFTLAVGGLVIPGEGEPVVSAIAWAADTVLALGSDEEVMAISRGDSHLIGMGGAVVVPLGPQADQWWPTQTQLEVGGPADFAVLDADPRIREARALAVVRGGRVIEGALPPQIPWP